MEKKGNTHTEKNKTGTTRISDRKDILRRSYMHVVKKVYIKKKDLQFGRPTRLATVSEGDGEEQHEANRKQDEQAQAEGQNGVVAEPADEVSYLWRGLLQAAGLLHEPLAQVVHFGGVVVVEALAQRAVGLGSLDPRFGDEVVRLPSGRVWLVNGWVETFGGKRLVGNGWWETFSEKRLCGERFVRNVWWESFVWRTFGGKRLGGGLILRKRVRGTTCFNDKRTKQDTF